MAHQQQGTGGLPGQVVQGAIRLIRGGVPAEDRTDDPAVVALRYLTSVDPAAWEFKDAAFNHTQADATDEASRELKAILAALGGKTTPKDSMVELLTTAEAPHLTATREDGFLLVVTFRLALNRLATAYQGDPPLNPRKVHSIVGKIVRMRNTAQITVFHAGPGFGVAH